MALLVKLEKYLYSSDYQFGFKSKHSTDLCICTLELKWPLTRKG